jgi:DNA primase
MGIAETDIAKVRDATDLVAVVSEHLQLKRVGQRWVGLCPFHNEKSGSFSVNQQLGFYHCFGCQASGDAITFVREVEGLDFVGAVERLAGKAGIALTYTSADEGRQRAQRRRLIEAVGAAVDFYHDRLLKAPDAGVARAYLRDRDISGDEVRSYKIGWAPDDWDALAKSLKLPDKVLTEAGLGFLNRRGRVQDTFRARILFPIYDVNNDPVGFGGRKLPDAEGPKYKNSSDSSIYSKSRLLYGLNWAKEHVVKADEVIVCEGYTDVMGYAKAGVPRAVATCGTALTEEHVKILKRFAHRVVLSFDADAAGQAAAERFYEWEKKYEIDVGVVSLPPGVDPGDLARTDPQALAQAVEDAKPFLSFRVSRVLDTADLSTVEGRARAADAGVEIVRSHPNPLVRDQYLMQIADRCGVAVDQLRAVATGGRSRPAAPSNSDGAVVIDLVDSVELEVLRLAVHHPELVPSIVDVNLFVDPLHQDIFRSLLDAPTLPGAVAMVDDRARPLLQRLLVEEPEEIEERAAQGLVGRLFDEAAARELGRLERLARQTGDATVGRDVAALHNALVKLRDDSWQLSQVDALLPWLRGADTT